MIGPVALLPVAQVQTLRPPALALNADFGLELAAVAVGLLFVLFVLMRRRDGRLPKPREGRARNWILVDGSNVMHWEDNIPQIEPVRRVVSALKARGLDPGVVFDANVGWKLFGRYVGEGELSKLLDLPQDQILVVPKGSPADPWLLTTARDYGARIVTNDRYRDWTEMHPEVAKPGFLVHGGLSGTNVWLEGMLEPTDRKSV